MTKDGIEGDGVITLILGVVGLVLIASTLTKGAVVSMLLALAVLAIGIYDVFDVLGTSTDSELIELRASVGIGLWLTVVASGMAASGSFLRWGQIRQGAQSAAKDTLAIP